MQITTLVENEVGKAGLLAEHGLSFLIETDNETILFDTGQGCALIHNAEEMGVDLSKVNKIVLSHGHADHTGGLKDALKACGGANVYAHPGAFDEKYSVAKCQRRSIGIPYTIESLELMGAKLHLSKEPVQIAPGIQTTGEIPRVTDFEVIPDRLCTIKENNLIKDELKDDLSLIIQGKNGILVVFGCGHSGIINTLKKVDQLMHNTYISMVIGGIHLIDASKGRIDKTIQELDKFNIDKMGLCHCTGKLATIRLYEHFGGKVFFNHVGTNLEWY
ncbi:MBL fold metallo-hydrolase [Candidatus Poribacteria bacterium]|nr:MBL fold metallo-hydrolase [Candidatus Poribacteria bacterium]